MADEPKRTIRWMTKGIISIPTTDNEELIAHMLDVEITIDIDGLAMFLAAKATQTKRRNLRAMKGTIRAKVVDSPRRRDH